MNERAEGFGIYIHSKDGSARYEGEWKDDVQHGYGEETFENGYPKY